MPAKLTVVKNVYFQRSGKQPESLPARYVTHIASDEQMYVRELTVGPTWIMVDTGWVAQPSLISIENNARVGNQKVPTPEELAAVAQCVLLLGVMPVEQEKHRDMHSPPRLKSPVLFAEVLPGQSSEFRPCIGATLYMRSVHQDKFTCTLRAVPR